MVFILKNFGSRIMRLKRYYLERLVEKLMKRPHHCYKGIGLVKTFLIFTINNMKRKTNNPSKFPEDLWLERGISFS